MKKMILKLNNLEIHFRVFKKTIEVFEKLKLPNQRATLS